MILKKALSTRFSPQKKQSEASAERNGDNNNDIDNVRQGQDPPQSRTDVTASPPTSFTLFASSDQQERRVVDVAPILISIGPPCCGKSTFLESLKEDFVEIAPDKDLSLFERVPIKLALEVWQDNVSVEARKALNDRPHLTIKLKNIGDEIMLIVLLFKNKITLSYFEEGLKFVISNDIDRYNLIEVVREVYASDGRTIGGKDHDNRSSKVKFESKTIDVFLPEMAKDVMTAMTARMQSATLNDPALLCWGGNNTNPANYRPILKMAFLSSRVVRFVRWGIEIPAVSIKELLKRSLMRFLKTGRYYKSTSIADSLRAVHTLLAPGATATTNSHIFLAKQAGYHMDECGFVKKEANGSSGSSKSRSKITALLRGEPKKPLVDRRPPSPIWSAWGSEGEVRCLHKEEEVEEEDMEVSPPRSKSKSKGSNSGVGSNSSSGRQKSKKTLVKDSDSHSTSSPASSSASLTSSATSSPVGTTPPLSGVRNSGTAAAGSPEGSSTPVSALSTAGGNKARPVSVGKHVRISDQLVDSMTAEKQETGKSREQKQQQQQQQQLQQEQKEGGSKRSSSGRMKPSTLSHDALSVVTRIGTAGKAGAGVGGGGGDLNDFGEASVGSRRAPIVGPPLILPVAVVDHPDEYSEPYCSFSFSSFFCF